MTEPSYPNAPSQTCFQDGLEYQDFICQFLAPYGIILQNYSSKKYQQEIGENKQGFEIKLDRGCVKYGHLSIEVAEKSYANCPVWTPSGIYRNDNSWFYIQGNYEIIFMFAKNFLRQWKEEKNVPIGDRTPTVQSFFLEFDVAKKHAIKYFETGIRTTPRYKKDPVNDLWIPDTEGLP